MRYAVHFTPLPWVATVTQGQAATVEGGYSCLTWSIAAIESTSSAQPCAPLASSILPIVGEHGSSTSCLPAVTRAAHPCEIRRLPLDCHWKLRGEQTVLKGWCVPTGNEQTPAGPAHSLTDGLRERRRVVQRP